MNYVFTKHAWRDMRKFELDVQCRIIEKVRFYLSQKDPLHFADKLSGGSGKEYRYRVGDYRVIFDWEEGAILITKVLGRSKAYPRHRH